MTKAAELAKMGEVLTNSQIGGRRNLILNPKMQVAQRSASVSGITSLTYSTCDRYRLNIDSLGTWTSSQSTDAPDGFSNSFKIECTTADASPAADDFCSMQQFIEAQNLQHLDFGSASAKNLVLSFWVKSNKVGTYTGYFYRQDSTRIFSHEYTINTANTWEYKTVKIAGDTTGTIANDNGRGIQVHFNLAQGSNRATGSVLSSWADYTNASQEGSANEINLADTVGNTWQITGIQLEVGSVATPFEHRSYAEELALCQRYFNIFGTDTSNAYENFGTAVAFGSGAGDIRMPMNMPVTMRAIPSVAHSGAFACIGQLNIGTLSSIGLADGGSPTNIMLNITGSNSNSSGDVSPFRSNNDVDAFISFDSEL